MNNKVRLIIFLCCFPTFLHTMDFDPVSRLADEEVITPIGFEELEKLLIATITNAIIVTNDGPPRRLPYTDTYDRFVNRKLAAICARTISEPSFHTTANIIKIFAALQTMGQCVKPDTQWHHKERIENLVIILVGFLAYQKNLDYQTLSAQTFIKAAGRDLNALTTMGHNDPKFMPQLQRTSAKIIYRHLREPDIIWRRDNSKKELTQ